MASKLQEIQLSRLDELVPMPPGKAGLYLEACVWCMDQNGHHNGVELVLQFDGKTHKYPVYWPANNLDLEKIRTFYNLDDAVCFGAEAIAFFVCINHTEYNALQRSTKKTGIDYWLGHQNADPNLPFQNSGRLEISGILKENETNTLAKRIKQKIEQSSQSENSSLPVYIVVVAFDRPYAKMVLKNVNS